MENQETQGSADFADYGEWENAYQTAAMKGDWSEMERLEAVESTLFQTEVADNTPPVEEVVPVEEVPQEVSVEDEGDKPVATPPVRNEIDERLQKSQAEIEALAVATEELTPPVKPARPKRPSIPTDPMDWSAEDSALYNDYQQQLEEYDEKKDSYNEELADYKAKLYVEQYRAKENEARIAEAKDRLFWDSNRKLQQEIPSLATSRDLYEVHKDVTAFAVQLASTMGISRTDEDYSAKLDYIVDAYNKGDADVVAKANSAGIQKPTDYDAYIAMAELHAEKQRGIEENIYTQNTPLSLVYVNKAVKSGNLQSIDEAVNRARANAIAGANKSVRTPSNSPYVDNNQRSFDRAVGNQVINAELAKLGLSDDEISLYTEMDANPNLAFDPKLSKRFFEIQEKIDRAI